MTGYSIYLYANHSQLHASFLTINLDEISGGHSPSQTTATPVSAGTPPGRMM